MLNTVEIILEILVMTFLGHADIALGKGISISQRGTSPLCVLVEIFRNFMI